MNIINRQFTETLQRDVYCLFGLPVDNLTLTATKELVQKQALLQTRLVLSTININWVVRSFSDPQFYAAICNSDLVVLDGKPLVWLAKLLDLPFRETVAGSTLVQTLLEDPTVQPLTIFLFGGDGKVAEIAMERINQCSGGLRAVGAINPGHGSVDDLSADKFISSINKACPDILLVALGAEKGVAWIEKNRHKINAKVISHLGATINFLAGTVKRAPRFLQHCGLEWLWRIGQEPKLFSRYASDGLRFFRLLVRLAPNLRRYRGVRRRYMVRQGDVLGHWQESDRHVVIRLGPSLRIDHASPLREEFARVTTINKNLLLDFQATEYIDSSFFGLLLLVRNQLQKNGNSLTCIKVNRRLAYFFHVFCMQACLKSEAGHTT